jgi:hypothetical protein
MQYEGSNTSLSATVQLLVSAACLITINLKLSLKQQCTASGISNTTAPFNMITHDLYRML